MLDNEPTGGTEAGVQPTTETAADTESTTRRTRAPRKKAVKAAAPEATVEVTDDQPAEVAKPARRTRKKAVPAAAASVPDPTTSDASVQVTAEAAPIVPAPVAEAPVSAPVAVARPVEVDEHVETFLPEPARYESTQVRERRRATRPAGAPAPVFRDPEPVAAAPVPVAVPTPVASEAPVVVTADAVERPTRRATRPAGAPTPVKRDTVAEVPAAPAAETPAPAPAAEVTERRTRRATRPAGAPTPVTREPAAEESVSAEPVAEEPARRTRTRTSRAAKPVVVEPVVEPVELDLDDEDDEVLEDVVEAVVEPEPEPEKPTGRRRRGAAAAATVLFMPPEPVVTPAPVAAPASFSPFEVPAAAPFAVPEPVTRDARSDDEDEDEAPTGRRRRTRRGAAAVEDEAPADEVTEAAEAEETDEDDEDHDSPESRRNRRRRGRRGRGRGKGGADDYDESEDEPTAESESEPEEAEEDEETSDTEVAADGSLRRRRRSRRRRGSGDAETSDDPNVVVKIREPRSAVDEVQGVSGSTRLEAKRQRRRDGREQRRTRPPILTEAEFLARREAVDRVMVVRQLGDRTQTAVLEDGILVEHYVARASQSTMVGNVYLGRVQNVLPSMEAAFVDIGRGRNAVLYAGEVNWEGAGLSGRGRSIEQALKPGDSVLVQVTKDPVGHKGARLTSHIALSGRHLVYVPHGNASGISRKLSDIERKRLRDILKHLVPEEAGVIVRTAAEGASSEELERDVTRLQAQWETIEKKAKSGSAPVALYEEPDLVIRVVRDLFNEDFRELVIEGEDAWEQVEPYLAHVSPDLVDRLRRHTGTVDVFQALRIDEQIMKALDRKVFLPSGGSLVIDRTEAMTVVDVNTGKFIGHGGNLEETVTKNNLEAAEEIVRQLRLRDIGGIIVIDFIDMVLESNRELVLRRLTECLGRDRTKHQVTEITSLGLVQMTRKRMGQGLLEAFSEQCDCCKGRGLIIHTEPIMDGAQGGGGHAGRGGNNAPAASAPASGGDEPREGKKSRRRRGKGESSEAEPAADDTAESADAPEPVLVGAVSAAGSTPTITVRASDDDPDAAVESDEGAEGAEGAEGGRRRRRSSSRRRGK
ncbi:Rne/Rng family ribonuclease [Longispora sp. NPDC051575]|uniref:Rne/Rng family ribonuclease n=1 Tax=Longispora sp. NPDC051575 TaxID=3154943 RepID=UPI00342CCC38